MQLQRSGGRDSRPQVQGYSGLYNKTLSQAKYPRTNAGLRYCFFLKKKKERIDVDILAHLPLAMSALLLSLTVLDYLEAPMDIHNYVFRMVCPHQNAGCKHPARSEEILKAFKNV